ncbi:hypothetical protein CEY16_07075 [Halalkalibacillus sediminis]|uniref:YndJ-like protein n=1 Tax=Halalkalibacillus sediminis TaxID=2018042 RepID=A0A2I0QTQ5_9BACI|nr:YndJ family protein [Halalkalibacillus sediminis]PKR77688.1 hypothetical protein CEY16_07075 [Halalkalibacillus sediminis]
MNLQLIGLFNIITLAVIGWISSTNIYLLILTAAQLIYVPMILHLLLRENGGVFSKWLPRITIGAMTAVVATLLVGDDVTTTWLAMAYWVFTMAVALFGISRLLQPRYRRIEEVMINIGMIYLVIGGGWFLASEAGIDTGFSPIITWLTGVHFHYAAFLFPIFTGFLGRLHQSKLYRRAAIVVAIAPIFVALGITYSVTLELISVLLYIFGIYSLILVAFRTKFANRLQRWLCRISFSALGVTILFSLMYAYGNWSGQFTITIDFMLQFHGVTNELAFGLLGVIGWSLAVPSAKPFEQKIPVSHIRGGWKIGEGVVRKHEDSSKSYAGLVDDMAVFSEQAREEKSVIDDFYENTVNYRLYARVKWLNWFKPFAAIFRLISKGMQQLNLPLRSERVEMTGDILAIDDAKDSRQNVRAWIRKVDGDTVFVALYSIHSNNGITFTNIALPLPFSTMVGVLRHSKKGKGIQLTSKKSTDDAGIYLAGKKMFFRLPIDETFYVEESEKGHLTATHRMWIFSIPFLRIEYDIERKRGEEI